MEQEEAEKLQRVRVHKELEQEFDLGTVRASDRTSRQAELRVLAREWLLPTVRWRRRW